MTPIASHTQRHGGFVSLTLRSCRTTPIDVYSGAASGYVNDRVLFCSSNIGLGFGCVYGCDFDCVSFCCWCGWSDSGDRDQIVGH
jgi:hypothetical protein